MNACTNKIGALTAQIKSSTMTSSVSEARGDGSKGILIGMNLKYLAALELQKKNSRKRLISKLRSLLQTLALA